MNTREIINKQLDIINDKEFENKMIMYIFNESKIKNHSPYIINYINLLLGDEEVESEKPYKEYLRLKEKFGGN